MAVHAVVVCAGGSKRMGGVNKITAPVQGKTLLYHTLKPFQDSDAVDDIVIVSRKEDQGTIQRIVDEGGFSKAIHLVEGGKERQDSVRNGLHALESVAEDDIIAVHNGANPLVTVEEIEACVEKARERGAAVCAFPAKDTLKSVDKDVITGTIDRAGVWQMQTPQCFRYGLLLKAHQKAQDEKLAVTDDAMMVEALGEKAHVVPCSYQNIKVTTPEDLQTVEGVLSVRQGGSPMRTGLGQDSHRFASEKKPLVLGGYAIEGEQGLDGNSDADVILHALFNAVSSALGERSLGQYADELCKTGVTDSREYLKVIVGKMQERGYSLGNVAISVEAKRPKLEPWHDKIKESLMEILGLPAESIGLTFTSGEGLTGMGKGEGMACTCQAILRRG